jgi:hypothetical protein
LTARIDRDHLRLARDEQSRGYPSTGTHIEDAKAGEWFERVEHLSRIRGACGVILVGDHVERSHVAIIAESTRPSPQTMPSGSHVY